MEYQLEIRDASGVHFAPIDVPRAAAGEQAADAVLDPLPGPTWSWGEVHVRVVPAVEAELEEIPAVGPSGSPVSSPAGDWPVTTGAVPATPGELQALDRLRAGIRAEGRRAPRDAVKHWQQRVLAGEFDADQCAQALNVGASSTEEAALIGRTGALLRDMLMAELASGVRGVARRARTATRSVVARIAVQFFALAVYSLMAFAGLLLLRFQGVELDGFFDSILNFFGLEASASG